MTDRRFEFKIWPSHGVLCDDKICLILATRLIVAYSYIYYLFDEGLS